MTVASSAHSWLPAAMVSHHTDSPQLPMDLDIGCALRRDRHRLLLVAKSEGHRGVERQSSRGHEDHHRHGRDPVDAGVFTLRFHVGREAAARSLHPLRCTSAKTALGFLGHTRLPAMLGLFGIIMAFGHSVLAMSGEETLAQVNREIEHPKLRNLKRAAIVIAIYSFLFTGLGSLLAVMLIPGFRAGAGVPGQSHCRPGDVHGRAAGDPDCLPCLRSAGGVPDSFRSHQYLDYWIDRGVDAHRRRRGADRLVPANRIIKFGTSYRIVNLVVGDAVVHDRRQAAAM